MPLQLGDASHERGHEIRWNTSCATEASEAMTQAAVLRERGFTELTRGPGHLYFEPPARDPNIGLFRILSESGDDLITWDRREPSQIREAYAKYNELIKKGYRAYATNSAGKRSHRIDDFDPSLEEIILVPSTIPG